MAKQNRLSKQQNQLKQRVISAYSRPYGIREIPAVWEKNLFKKSTDAIYKYIENRFYSTTDVIEYYVAMCFLYKKLPNSVLLVEWKNSANVCMMCESYNHLGKKSTQVSTTTGDSCMVTNDCTDELDILKTDISNDFEVL